MPNNYNIINRLLNISSNKTKFLNYSKNSRICNLNNLNNNRISKINNRINNKTRRKKF